MSCLSLGEIARIVGGTLDGDPDLIIEGVRAFDAAGPREIAIAAERAFLDILDRSRAGALVVPEDCTTARPNIVRVHDARRAFVPLLAAFAGNGHHAPGIDPFARIAPDAFLGDDVHIAAGAWIGARAILADGVQIHANAVIGNDCIIGPGSIIHPNVTLYPGCRIGARVIIHAGTVVGSDGFGYDGLTKIPQLGIVIIEDDVEIGANCAIDRATLEATRIGAGTKIDNLVQVGHNADIGPGCLIVGQAGVSGSVTLGAGVMLGGQAGVSDHVKVGPGVRVGAKSGLHANTESGDWIGTPAMPREKAGRVFAFLPHLPDYRERVRALEARIEELQKHIEDLKK